MKSQSGQILLMIILLVSLAISISAASLSRSTVDIHMTKQIEESEQALKAAEAGVEQALLTGTASENFVMDQNSSVTFTTTINTTGNSGQYEMPAYYNPGEVANVWLSKHVGSSISTNKTDSYTGNSLIVCWKDSADVPAAAVSVYYFDRSINDYKTYSTAYDTNAVSRQNNFSIPTTCSQNSNYNKSFTLNLTSLGLDSTNANITLLLMRLRPIYGGTQFVVIPETNLPEQGKVIESTGLTSSGLTRKILVQQEYAAPPLIFDSVLWSKTNI
jgi:hypothetical protein